MPEINQIRFNSFLSSDVAVEPQRQTNASIAICSDEDELILFGYFAINSIKFERIKAEIAHSKGEIHCDEELKLRIQEWRTYAERRSGMSVVVFGLCASARDICVAIPLNFIHLVELMFIEQDKFVGFFCAPGQPFCVFISSRILKI